MGELDLKALLAQDAPLARDLSFELGVTARIEEQRFRQALLRNFALAALGALLLALLMPLLEMIWRNYFAATISNGMIAVALFTLTLLGQGWAALRRT